MTTFFDELGIQSMVLQKAAAVAIPLPEDFGLFRFASIFNECAMVHSATRSCSDLFTTIKSMNIMLCVCSSAVVLLCSSIEASHSCYTTKYVTIGEQQLQVSCLCLLLCSKGNTIHRFSQSKTINKKQIIILFCINMNIFSIILSKVNSRYYITINQHFKLKNQS